MPYLAIADFKFGLDRRRKRVAGVPGTLWDGKNVHIGNGGDIERALKFVSAYTGLANTFGLGAIRGQITVFGSADLSGTLPAGISYQRLQHPGALAMTRVVDVRAADGKFFVIAEYADGNIYEFYNGTRLTDWDAISDGNATISTTAEALALKISANDDVLAIAANDTIVVTALADNTAFSISATTTDGGGATDQDATITLLQAAASGLPQISAVRLEPGTAFNALDQFAVTVNGTEYRVTGRGSGAANSAFVNKTRVYAPAGSTLRYSKINDPADWTDASLSSGAGFINMPSESEGSERLVAAARYQNYAAIFSRKTIRIYDLQADAQTSSIVETLEATGTMAPRSVTPYGNTDLFYLDDSGVRSVRARQNTSSAYASGVGSAIDRFVQDYRATLDKAAATRAVGTIEPIDGRFWLALGERILVLSYFPETKVNAWTYYEPGFTPTDFVRVDDRIYARDANTIYLYGGSSGATYPGASEQTLVVETPFMGAGKPATFKEWTGFDIACTGDWHIELLVDPNDETKVVTIGVISQTTLGMQHIRAVGRSPVFAVRATCASAGEASISSMVAHYDEEEAG